MAMGAQPSTGSRFWRAISMAASTSGSPVVTNSRTVSHTPTHSGQVWAARWSSGPK